jgi:hypothetical protein
MVSELCPGQSSKCKNEQRAIATKFGKAEFKFLFTAHLPIEVHLPVDISCSFELRPGQDFSKRGDISNTGQNRVMVLVHCTFTY